ATTSAGPRHGRALVGGAVALLALATAVTLWLWRDGSPDDDALATTEPFAVTSRSGSCTAATCAGEPIAFVIEPTDASVTTVRLTDPSGFPVESAQPPTLTDSTLEWRWSAGYSDPIGEYAVVFVVDGEEQPPQTFRVEATDGPFGVVQQLAV